MTGVVQNQDSYMKGRLGQRAFYDRLPGELDARVRRVGGADRSPLRRRRAYRCEDAAEIVIAMGTMADTATAVVDHLRGLGRPVGCVALTSFRPFPADGSGGDRQRPRGRGHRADGRTRRARQPADP